MNNFSLVKEKIEAPKIIVLKENNTLKFFKKQNIEISIIDRTLIGLYEQPINYFNNLDINLFEDNKLYYFNYVFDDIPVSIKYKIPKNNLILVNILDKQNNYYDLNNYNIFNTDIQNSIFIDEQEIDLIKNDFNKIIEKYNYKHILENDIINSLIITKVKDNKITESINYTINKKEQREYSDFNSVLAKDLINFVKKIDLNNLIFNHNNNKDIAYLNFVYEIYNKYKTNIVVNSLDVFNKDLFKLNYTFISELNIKNENLYKFIINLFRKDKYINSKLFSSNDLKVLKNIIYIIDNRVKQKNTLLPDLNKKKSSFEFNTFNEFINKK